MVKFSVTPGRSFDFASLKLPSADVRVCRKTNGRQHKRQGVQLLLQLELCSCRRDFVRTAYDIKRKSELSGHGSNEKEISHRAGSVTSMLAGIRSGVGGS